MQCPAENKFVEVILCFPEVRWTQYLVVGIQSKAILWRKVCDWIIKEEGNFESLREISEMSELELSINGKQFFDN